MPQSDWENLDRNITASWGDLRVPEHLSQFGRSQRRGFRSNLLSGILKAMAAVVLVVLLLATVCFVSYWIP